LEKGKIVMVYTIVLCVISIPVGTFGYFVLKMPVELLIILLIVFDILEILGLDFIYKSKK
jgi:hypothetical protein